MYINLRRDTLTAPGNPGSAALVTVWGMGGRVFDLPKRYQDHALRDLQKLHPWPADLYAAHWQVNRLDAVEDESC